MLGFNRKTIPNSSRTTFQILCARFKTLPIPLRPAENNGRLGWEQIKGILGPRYDVEFDSTQDHPGFIARSESEQELPLWSEEDFRRFGFVKSGDTLSPKADSSEQIHQGGTYAASSERNSENKLRWTPSVTNPFRHG